MAAINFPGSPNDGDVFDGYVYDATYSVWNRANVTLGSLEDVDTSGAVDGQTLVYDANSDSWIPGEGGSSFAISETAPTPAEAGDVWYNSSTGKTYIYYTDVDGSQWVEIASTTVGFLDIDQLNDVNAPTPADGESLVYDSATSQWVNADATVEVYGVDTAATDYFMIPVGTDAQRPVTPANGYIRFNTDSGEPEYYSEAEGAWFLFRQAATSTFEVEYLVVAGGGGGGYNGSAGGGAGGYRSSISGESSGGGVSAESPLTLDFSTNYTVTVGAGGNGSTSNSDESNNGFSSLFAAASSLGGGGGGTGSLPSGLEGGSGGGRRFAGSVGPGTPGQGFAGGAGAGTDSGGGGGAGEAGDTDGVRHGGDGVSSLVTGSSVTRGGGGSGASDNNTSNITGGLGGGGTGGNSRTNGEVNTGGGGGGGSGGLTGANGGSGIVIIKYPASITATPTVGLVSTTSTLGDFKVTQFTSGTGTVTFA